MPACELLKGTNEIMSIAGGLVSGACGRYQKAFIVQIVTIFIFIISIFHWLQKQLT